MCTQRLAIRFNGALDALRPLVCAVRQALGELELLHDQCSTSGTVERVGGLLRQARQEYKDLFAHGRAAIKGSKDRGDAVARRLLLEGTRGEDDELGLGMAREGARGRDALREAENQTQVCGMRALRPLHRRFLRALSLGRSVQHTLLVSLQVLRRIRLQIAGEIERQEAAGVALGDSNQVLQKAGAEFKRQHPLLRTSHALLRALRRQEVQRLHSDACAVSGPAMPAMPMQGSPARAGHRLRHPLDRDLHICAGSPVRAPQTSRLLYA